MVGHALVIRTIQCAFKRSTFLRCSRQIRSFSSKEDPDKWIIPSRYPDVNIPDVTVTSHIFDAQEKHAGKIAMINGETQEKVTHGELRDLGIRFGSALCRIGATKGDVIALILPNCIEFSVSFLGISCAGGTPTTINSAFTSFEIGRQLENSGASMVVCCEEILQKVQAAIKDKAGIREVIVVGDEHDGVRSYKNLLKDDGKGIPHYSNHNNREDIAVLPYSSGTTGLPKGVMLTHRNLVANLQQATLPEVSYFRHTSDDYQDTLMMILPMYHIYGMACGLFATLYHGCRIVTLRNFDQQLFAKLYRKYKATMAYTVPPLLSFMANSDLMPKESLENTHTVVCAAAPVGPSLLNQVQKKFGTHLAIMEGYGMTELSPVSHTTPKNGPVVFGSCGVSISNTETKIVDLETGLSLPPNEKTGELWVRGPQVMKGYLNNPQATKDTITPDSWLRTGDIAKSDELGNIFIVDRLKELIKVKGLQVPPAELEDILRSHPGVQDVAVIGIPDERSGEIPKAFVVPKPNLSVSEKDIMNFLDERVVEYKRLAGGVSFIDMIPKNPSGKILRKDLKNL